MTPVTQTEVITRTKTSGTPHLGGSTDLMIFRAMLGVFFAVSILNEYLSFSMSQSIDPGFLGNLALSITTILTFAWSHLTKNLRRTMVISAFAHGACLTLIFFTSAELKTEYLIYLSIFQLASGLLLGDKAAIYTTIHAVAIFSIAGIVSTMGIYGTQKFVPANQWPQIYAWLFFIGFLSMSISKQRKRQEHELAMQTSETDAQKQKSIKLESIINETQSIAKIGSWHYEPTTRSYTCSREMRSIFEIDEHQSPQEQLRACLEKIHPQDVQVFKKLIENAIAHGDDFSHSGSILLDAAGRTKYVHVTTKSTKNDQGNVFSIRGSVQDITHDIHEEGRFSAVIEAMSEGLVIQDETGAIIMHNAAAPEILGLSADQLNGRTSMDPRWRAVRENGDPFEGQDHPAMVCLRTGKPQLGVTMGLHLPNGDLRWIRINAVPKANSPQKRVVCTFTDITALVAANDEIRFILDSLGIGIWQFNPRTSELTWDNSMYKLFGVKQEDFSGDYQAWESMLTPESRSSATQDLELALRGEKEFNSTFEIKTTSGEKRFIAGRGKVQRDERGQAQMMFGINWDRTKEVLDESAMERQRELIEAVLNNLPNMVFAKDYNKDLSFILFNKAGEKLLGVSAANLIDKNDHDLFPKQEADFFTSKDREVFAKKETLKIDQEIISTPSGQRYLRTYKVPTYRHDGTPDLLIGISTDITDEVKMQQSLDAERAKSMHTAKLASLGELAAGVAHEINNPLAIISGNIPLLKRFKDDPEKLNEKLEAVKSSVERITKIVNGLRKFSRTSNDNSHTKHKLMKLVDEVVVLTDVKAKRFATPIEWELASNSEISCDPFEIQQVVINLINNAVDAVQAMAEKWVKVKLFDEGSQVVLQVIDSGPGISADVELKLFQPFFTTKAVGEGTGLGLSISKGICEQHGGTLTLNRKAAHTCFEVRFKIAGVRGLGGQHAA
jgi:PAS domain S-box-containing protein